MQQTPEAASHSSLKFINLNIFSDKIKKKTRLVSARMIWQSPKSGRVVPFPSFPVGLGGEVERHQTVESAPDGESHGGPVEQPVGVAALQVDGNAVRLLQETQTTETRSFTSHTLKTCLSSQEDANLNGNIYSNEVPETEAKLKAGGQNLN